MLVSDLMGILIAVLLAGVIRWVVLGPLTLVTFRWVPAYVAIFIISAALRGLYPATDLSTVNHFRLLTIGTSVLFLVFIAGTFVFKISEEFSRLLLGLTWLFSLVTIPFIRTLVRHLMAQAGQWGEPVVVIGSAPQVQSLNNYLRRYPTIGLKPDVTITLPGLISDLTSAQRDELVEQARRLNAISHLSTVLVAYEQMGELGNIREFFRDLFERVVLVNPADFGSVLGGVAVRQYGEMLTFEIHNSLMDPSAQIQKRVIDILGAGLGLLLLSPLLGCISLAIALGSPGGVLYRQRRLGKHGQEFDMLKFRTMRSEADQVLSAYLQQNPERQQEWNCYQKLKDDPRITRLGCLLRRFSLDELPQLWNVLIGKMSIIGPRPIMVNQREIYGANFLHYMRVVPGMTGLWQVSGRNRTSFTTRTEFDVEYVMNWSIWVDIYILVRTFWIVLRRDES